jgi:DNA-binding Lrp family transcriptional regulator
MFDAIAFSGNENDLMNELSLSRKQYYSRVNKLVNTGLIQRRHGNYSLTAFGKVIYSVSLTFSKAIDNRGKFKAIDAMKEKNKLTNEEYQNATDLLLDDEKFKEIILTKS